LNYPAISNEHWANFVGVAFKQILSPSADQNFGIKLGEESPERDK
jgi:hypothetical protein